MEVAMPITTLSSREFNQDTGRAKKAARKGPVFITDRGKPAHVLLSITEYQKITKQRASILDALAMPGVAEIDFDPQPLGRETYPPIDLS
jgi:prevent-host-death family protein